MGSSEQQVTFQGVGGSIALLSASCSILVGQGAQSPSIPTTAFSVFIFIYLFIWKMRVDKSKATMVGTELPPPQLQNRDAT